MQRFTRVSDIGFRVIGRKRRRFKDRGVQQAGFTSCGHISEIYNPFWKLYQNSQIIALVLLCRFSQHVLRVILDIWQR